MNRFINFVERLDYRKTVREETDTSLWVGRWEFKRAVSRCLVKFYVSLGLVAVPTFWKLMNFVTELF